MDNESSTVFEEDGTTVQYRPVFTTAFGEEMFKKMRWVRTMGGYKTGRFKRNDGLTEQSKFGLHLNVYLHNMATSFTDEVRFPTGHQKDYELYQSGTSDTGTHSDPSCSWAQKSEPKWVRE